MTNSGDNPTKVAWYIKVQQWLNKTLNAGAGDHSFTNASRRAFIINLFCLVGVLFTAPLSIVSLVQGYWLVGSVLLTIAVIYIINHLYLRATHNYLFSANVILYPLYALMLYLVYSGGVNGTGHVWIYCIPPVSLFLHGLRRGLIEVGAFLAALVVILFLIPSPFDELGYHPDLKSRIVYSFILVGFLSTIYEYISSRFNQSLQELSHQLEVAATTDPLTQLLNRRGLEQQLAETDWMSPSIVLLDIDFFKRINDQYGHDYGDEYLVEVSQALKAKLANESCILSRWGGEEFLIVMKQQDSLKALTNQLREELAQVVLNTREGDEISTTVSMGVSRMKAGESMSKALNRADKALYEAKNSGRNKVVLA
ncbi:GGDEF domain-containing protein [Marinomonas ostreistagni]|uniref:GGDEF domain-containing protein n=1 Tax=Marinomonas ostreistagni TaxID=359209 RepID=UPI00194F03BF|nr:GGDEF domain-containing protein [Marinomonas ostreistagni]MBM6552142.1 GGDEF domain-containing protein [Marinomonas ostreistagni]